MKQGLFSALILKKRYIVKSTLRTVYEIERNVKRKIGVRDWGLGTGDWGRKNVPGTVALPCRYLNFAVSLYR